MPNDRGGDELTHQVHDEGVVQHKPPATPKCRYEAAEFPG